MQSMMLMCTSPDSMAHAKRSQKFTSRLIWVVSVQASGLGTKEGRKRIKSLASISATFENGTVFLAEDGMSRTVVTFSGLEQTASRTVSWVSKYVQTVWFSVLFFLVIRSRPHPFGKQFRLIAPAAITAASGFGFCVRPVGLELLSFICSGVVSLADIATNCPTHHKPRISWIACIGNA